MTMIRRRWQGAVVAAAAGALTLAIGGSLAATAVRSKPVALSPEPLQPATPVVPIACASELYAFMKVAEAARDLGADRRILNLRSMTCRPIWPTA